MSALQAPSLTCMDIDVHGIRVVRASLDAATMWYQPAVLSDDEQSRAARYRRPNHGQRFAAARSILRHVLGNELGLRSDVVPLQVDTDGRPFVRNARDFNLSHCDDTVLIALAPADLRVGIDIEPLDRDIDPDAIAARLLHPGEADAYHPLGAEARRLFVLRTWVWKEAYAKCTGEGIRLDLRTLTWEANGHVHRDGERTVAAVTMLPVGPSHVAALCWARLP